MDNGNLPVGVRIRSAIEQFTALASKRPEINSTALGWVHHDLTTSTTKDNDLDRIYRMNWMSLQNEVDLLPIGISKNAIVSDPVNPVEKFRRVHRPDEADALVLAIHALQRQRRKIRRHREHPPRYADDLIAPF